MRVFTKKILTAILSSEATLVALKVDRVLVEDCLAAIASPTYIKVASKRSIERVLRSVRLVGIKALTLSMKENEPNATDACWPGDIGSLEDLMESLYKKDLRTDVENFVWEFLETCVPPTCEGGKIFKFSYDSAMRAHPISIHVRRDATVAVEAYLMHVSARCTTDELRPSDCIHVCGLPDDDNGGMDVKYESMVTSGCPFKAGTLGCVLSLSDSHDNECSALDSLKDTGAAGKLPATDEPPAHAHAHPQLYGLTCNHVVSGILDDTNAHLLGPVVFKARDTKVDVALFELPHSTYPESTYNLLRFKPADSTFEPVLGERVFKCGASTGLTTGTLTFKNTSFMCAESGRRHSGLYEVTWDSDDVFAHSGDCGALYCVKRANFYIPIAMHVMSSKTRSFGCSMKEAIGMVLENIAGEFRNAPQAGAR